MQSNVLLLKNYCLNFFTLISISITRTSASTCVSKWKLRRHKHKRKRNGQVSSSCACAYACVVALRWLDTVFQGQYLPSLSINYVAINKDESLLWSGLQRHRSCHRNEIMLLPILLAAIYLGTGTCSSKIVHGSFFLQWRPRCPPSLSEICKSVIEILGWSFYG